MHLRAVEMENFKSFGGKTVIPFEKGFTAITGPNGSGKSNIGDAILFVLGPKSSKYIRAQKLTDLIYHGGQTKRAASFCSVELFFDNTDRVIPLDCNEVRLKRLVRRSASDNTKYNSSFFVNEERSSLGEFDKLLSHAHISAEGYNLVQQGDVNRIVTMGNVDRRRILEGIAGITHYDADIEKANEQRAVCEQNIDKIELIHNELGSQLGQLEEERDAALKYKHLQERLDLARKQTAFKLHNSMEAEISSVAAQMEDVQGKQGDITLKSEAYSNEITALSEKLLELEIQMSSKGGEEAGELKAKIDHLRIEVSRAKDAIETSRDAISSGKNELRETGSERIKLEKNLAAIKIEAEECRVEHEKILVELKDAQEGLGKVQDEAGRSNEAINDIQKKIIHKNKDIDDAREKTHSFELEKERLQEKIERLTVVIADLEESRRIYEFEIKDSEFELKELRKNAKASGDDLAGLQEEFDSKRTQESELYKQSEEVESALKRLTRDYNRLKAEAEAADFVNNNYGRAVKEILEARDLGELRGIHGTIAELAQVSSKYENAVQTAAGNRLMSIVVDDDECAADAISFLKKRNAGRATFLPLSKMSAGRPSGRALMAIRGSDTLGFAIELIKFKTEYRAAFWYVLKDTVVVKNLAQARKLMGGVRLVTIEGDLVEASGAMIGGSMSKSRLKFGAAREKKLDDVGRELRAATISADHINEELKVLKGEIVSLLSKLRDRGGTDGEASLKIKALEVKKKEYSQKTESITSEIDEHNGLLVETKEKDVRTGKTIQVMQEGMASLEAERDKLRERLMKVTPQELQEQVRAMQEASHHLTTTATQKNGETQTFNEKARLMQERLDEFIQRMEALNGVVEAAHKRVEDKTQEQTKLDVELRGLHKLEEGFNSELKKIHTLRDETYRLKVERENQAESLRTRFETNKDLLVGLKTKLTAAREKALELGSEVEDYEPGPDEVLPTIGELKALSANSEKEMRELEPVNMRSIDEYGIKEERVGELSAERVRITEERKGLVKLVKELVEAKTKGLLKVLDAVNINFGRTFAELSEGGKSELLLENPDNPFEGGLIIKAQPRGKKVLRLDALSGGERSLVSMAFIFAIQEHDPSPFYMLDEVDQNLDGVNAEYVARKVKRNSSNAQTIMVSLRKITLKEAHHVYGVTMGPMGFSQVVGEVNISGINQSAASTMHEDGDGGEGSAELSSPLVEAISKDEGKAAGSDDPGIVDGGGVHA